MPLTNQPESFSLEKRAQSIRHAIRGVTEMLKSEHNAWVHLFATVCVVAMAAILSVNATEWCFLILAIMAVWVSEALNTAFEFLCDVASPDFHPLVKKSKDVAAGAVLLSAIGAVIIALIIFIPHIALLF